MPRTKTPPSIKDERIYEDRRKQGDSKEKAARISNAAAAQGRSAVGKKGGRSGSYEDWKVPNLRQRAKELGVRGYSGKPKLELIKLIRNH